MKGSVHHKSNICYDLKAKAVDKKDGYELIDLNLKDGKYRPYLKMSNTSMPGIYHLEAVHPRCQTMEKAFMWRNGLNRYVNPLQLT